MENQVLDAIFNRRSIRRYTDQPVSSDQLDLILKAGQAAPERDESTAMVFCGDPA